MTTVTIEVPHVHTALAEILKHLSVEKNGQLPGNMGGKAYITAVDISAEVKRQFVANSLIFLPDEEVIKHETVMHKDRINTAIVIRGTYTILSTKDGSSVTVSGTGDGLATGTAVASNIGSTNALKNALLRTFLITEQSVEDASKQGDTAAPSATQQAINKARTPVKPTAGGGSQDKIREWIGNDEARKDQANAVVTRIKEEQKLTGVELYNVVAKELGA
jgi:hypothetical protein